MNRGEVYANGGKVWTNRRHIYADAPPSYIEVAEKNFLTDTFDSLPIETRKQLLGFSVINPFDDKVPESSNEADYREKLREQNYIEFNAEFAIYPNEQL